MVLAYLIYRQPFSCQAAKLQHQWMLQLHIVKGVFVYNLGDWQYWIIVILSEHNAHSGLRRAVAVLQQHPGYN
jgi:hypothetical protein